jgi:hypothetical protein
MAAFEKLFEQMKNSERAAILLILITVLISIRAFSEVWSDELAIYSSTDDAYLREADPNYTQARNDSCADYHNPGIGVHRFGQVYDNGTYYVPRSYLLFNTGSLGSDAVIDSARLYFYIEWLDTTTHWNMTVVEGYWDSDPPVACDFKTGVWIGEQGGGAKNTSGILSDWNYVALSDSGLSWIKKTGTTRLALRSDRDIEATAPSGSEQLQHRSADYTGTTYDPYLKIWYHTGAPPEQANRLLIKRQQRK